MAIAKRMIASYPESEFLFPGEKPGVPISNQTMLMLVRRMGYKDESGVNVVVTHGFRSTFKDWAEEETDFKPAVIEKAMAHAIDDAVEAAYRRGDLFRKRRQLMDAWARYCDQPKAASRGNVVSLHPRAAS
jgi:integrase